MLIDTSGSYDINLMPGGNVGIGTTVPGGSGTVGTKVLSLGNGTPPVGGVADQVSLFSQDNAGSAELYALDEVGNTPLLSPHARDYLDGLPVQDRPYPWAHRSENKYLGKKISVDMAGLAAEVERLTGKQFVVIEDVPKRDWDTDQEILRGKREQEIEVVTVQIAELQSQIDKEKDADKKAELEKQRDAIVVPKSYTKKRPPEWMIKRGVITQIK